MPQPYHSYPRLPRSRLESLQLLSVVRPCQLIEANGFSFLVQLVERLSFASLPVQILPVEKVEVFWHQVLVGSSDSLEPLISLEDAEHHTLAYALEVGGVEVHNDCNVDACDVGGHLGDARSVPEVVGTVDRKDLPAQ